MKNRFFDVNAQPPQQPSPFSALRLSLVALGLLIYTVTELGSSKQGGTPAAGDASTVVSFATHRADPTDWSKIAF